MFRALFAAAFGFLLLVTPAAAAEKWATYTNAAYGFSVELPGTPKAEDLEPAAEGKATNRLFSVESGPNAYGVSVINLPAGYGYDFDMGVAGVVNANNGTKISDEAITVQGYPARKVYYTAKDGSSTVTGWFIVVHASTRVFTVLTVQYDQVNQADVDRVLNSLKLLD